MKPVIPLKEYEKAIYRMFGMFPLLLMIISCTGVYIVKIINSIMKDGVVGNPFDPERLADAFLWGIIISVGIFYISRISAVRTAEKSIRLVDLEEEGIFIPCMDHGTWMKMVYGNLILTKERVYFQPERQLSNELDFDYKDRSDLNVAIGDPMTSVGLFLITGQKHMLEFKDNQGKIVGRFIMPSIETSMEIIKGYL